MKKHITRRTYLALSATAAAAGALPVHAEEQKKPRVPKRALGKTGVEIPIIGVGTGTKFQGAYKNRDDDAVKLLHYAVDAGITFFDTASSYGGGWSERRIGEVLKTRREEVFLATKMYGDTRDNLLREVEAKLKRLQTDHFDLLHIHKVMTMEEVDKLGQKDGSVETYYSLREQKVARFIGVTTHHDPLPITVFIERHDFDCVQIVLNAAMQEVDNSGGNGWELDPGSRHSFETITLPAARKKNMGILAMKVLGYGKLIGPPPHKADPQTLMRYAWSLPITASAVGMTSPKEVDQNAAWAAAFMPMPKEERDALSERLAAQHKVALDRYFTHHDDC